MKCQTLKKQGVPEPWNITKHGWFVSSFVVKEEFGSFIKKKAITKPYSCWACPSLSLPCHQSSQECHRRENFVAQPTMDTDGLTSLLAKLLTEVSWSHEWKHVTAAWQTAKSMWWFHISVSSMLSIWRWHISKVLSQETGEKDPELGRKWKRLHSLHVPDFKASFPSVTTLARLIREAVPPPGKTLQLLDQVTPGLSFYSSLDW